MQRQYGDSQLIAALQNEFTDAPADRRFGAAELAMLDQLHTRGYAATVDLARMIDIGPRNARVGCRRGLRWSGALPRGDVGLPAWSTLLDAEQMRTLLEDAGFSVKSWKIDTAAALEWVARTSAPPIDAKPPRGATVMRAALGENFRQVLANLGKNYVEGRADVLAAIMEAV